MPGRWSSDDIDIVKQAPAPPPRRQMHASASSASSLPALRRAQSAPGLLTPNQVKLLSQTLGNRATRDLLEDESDPDNTPSAKEKPDESLPKLNDWKSSTSRWGRRRGRDRILTYLDGQLDAYWKSGQGSTARLMALVNLYVGAGAWTSNAEARNKRMDRGEWGAFQQQSKALAASARASLVREAGIRDWELSQWLKEHFGVQMGHHGLEVDKTKAAEYLSEEGREQYRVTFSAGSAHLYQWWAENEAERWALTPADTSDSHGMDTDRDWEAGHWSYVISMDRALYASPVSIQAGASSEAGRYHSSYLRGAAVLCAGTLRITEGEITHLTLDSGHYQPGPWALANAIMTLEMYGVDLDQLQVKEFRGKYQSARDYLKGIDIGQSLTQNVQDYRARNPNQSRVYNAYVEKDEGEKREENTIRYIPIVITKYYRKVFDRNGTIINKQEFDKLKKRDHGSAAAFNAALEEFELYISRGFEPEEIVQIMQDRIDHRKRHA